MHAIDTNRLVLPMKQMCDNRKHDVLKTQCKFTHVTTGCEFVETTEQTGAANGFYMAVFSPHTHTHIKYCTHLNEFGHFTDHLTCLTNVVLLLPGLYASF